MIDDPGPVTRIDVFHKDGTRTVTDNRVVDDERKRIVSFVREMVAVEMGRTDWYEVRRQKDPTKPVPLGVDTKRTGLVTSVQVLELAAKRATTLAQLDALPVALVHAKIKEHAAAYRQELEKSS